MSGLKKDELLAVCGRQSELLEELAAELRERDGEIERLRATVTDQAEYLNSLEAENDSLSARLPALTRSLDELRERYETKTARLNEALRASCAMLEENFKRYSSELSARLAEVESASNRSSGMLASLSGRMSECASECARWEEKLSGLPGEVRPDEYESLVREFLGNLVEDLEKALAG